MLNKLMENLLMLGKMEEISCHAEADYEREPENAEYEARFDAAYANEFKYYIECVKLVQQISGGKIDFETAKKLVQTKRGELVKLLNKTA